MLKSVILLIAGWTFAGCASAPAPAAGPTAGAAPAGASDSSLAENAVPGVPVAFDVKPGPGTKAKCPISGETFVVAEDTEGAKYQGKHYVFCCPGCSGEFAGDPGHYADK